MYIANIYIILFKIVKRLNDVDLNPRLTDFPPHHVLIKINIMEFFILIVKI
jgi:hypothetical protein